MSRSRLVNYLRYLWMPGSDIFTRRRLSLEKYWLKGNRKVLDAGCGNGWFGYRAYTGGASVSGVSNQHEVIAKAQSFYNGYLGVSANELQFQTIDLYDLNKCTDRFDEIICYETLEHIKDDVKIVAMFHELLRPGGVLHLCCPNADHPRWQAEILDSAEKGGHVRTGYTLEAYENLLKPAGFDITANAGVGGPVLVFIQEKIQNNVRTFLGEAGAMAVCLLAIPFIKLDSGNPGIPFSIYVRAEKS